MIKRIVTISIISILSFCLIFLGILSFINIKSISKIINEEKINYLNISSSKNTSSDIINDQNNDDYRTILKAFETTSYSALDGLFAGKLHAKPILKKANGSSIKYKKQEIESFKANNDQEYVITIRYKEQQSIDIGKNNKIDFDTIKIKIANNSSTVSSNDIIFYDSNIFDKDSEYVSIDLYSINMYQKSLYDQLTQII